MPAFDPTLYEAEAYIALLDRFAVREDDDHERYADIASRIGELRTWFLLHPGWNLVDAAGACRVVKTPAVPDEFHGFADVRDAQGRDRTPREPRDYEMLCWVFWYAEEARDAQFLLSQLAERIESAAGEHEPGRIDWNQREHRMSLGRALNLLLALGILLERDSDEQDWVAHHQGETLFEFTDLARLVQPFLPAALPDDGGPGGELAALEEALRAETNPATRLYRHLLLRTAFHRHSDPEAYALLDDQESRRAIESSLAAGFEWTLEVTPQYAALVRCPELPASARNRFPLGRTACDVGLLLCGEIQDRQTASRRDAADRARFSETEVLTMLADLGERYGALWGALGSKGPSGLAAEVLPVLRQADLLEGPDPDGYYHFLPLAARFRGEYTSTLWAADADH